MKKSDSQALVSIAVYTSTRHSYLREAVLNTVKKAPIVLLSLTLSGLSGCASFWISGADQLQTNIPVSAQSEEHTQAENVPLWSDLVSASALEALLAEAEQNNPQLAASTARWKASMAAARISQGRTLPTLGGNVDGNRQRRAGTAFSTAGNSVTETATAVLAVNWELDIWGRLAVDAEVGQLAADEQQYLMQWTRFSLGAQLSKAWLDTIESQQQSSLARQREANLAENLDIIERGFDSGIRQALDVYSARAEAASSRANTESRLQTEQAIKRQLEVQLGRYPDGVLIAPDSAPVVAALPRILPLSLLNRRPDVLAAQRALEAQFGRVQSAKLSRLPSLNIRGNWGASNRALHQVLSGDDMLWNIASGLTAPIFQGGQLVAEQKRQNALLEAATADYKRIVLNALLETEQAMANEMQLGQQLQAAREAGRISDLAEQQAFESYLAGLTNINTWLQAQRTAFDRQSQLLQLESSFLKNRIDLYLALGGDFGFVAN